MLSELLHLSLIVKNTKAIRMWLLVVYFCIVYCEEVIPWLSEMIGSSFLKLHGHQFTGHHCQNNIHNYLKTVNLNYQKKRVHIMYRLLRFIKIEMLIFSLVPMSNVSCINPSTRYYYITTFESTMFLSAVSSLSLYTFFCEGLCLSSPAGNWPTGVSWLVDTANHYINAEANATNVARELAAETSNFTALVSNVTLCA